MELQRCTLWFWFKVYTRLKEHTWTNSTGQSGSPANARNRSLQATIGSILCRFNPAWAVADSKKESKTCSIWPKQSDGLNGSRKKQSLLQLRLRFNSSTVSSAISARAQLTISLLNMEKGCITSLSLWNLGSNSWRRHTSPLSFNHMNCIGSWSLDFNLSMATHLPINTRRSSAAIHRVQNLTIAKFRCMITSIEHLARMMWPIFIRIGTNLKPTLQF